MLAGMGTTAGVDKRALGGLTIDARTQPKRILTFRIGGTAKLPPAPAPAPIAALPDPTYRASAALAAQGAGIYNLRCIACHGINVESGGTAPDLRMSAVPQTAEAFRAVVHDGALEENGMPRFAEFSDAELAALRQFLRSRAADLRQGN